MHRILRASVFVLALPAALWAQETPADPAAGKLLRHLRDELPAIRDTLRELDEAPERSWLKDKSGYQAEIDTYLDEALDLVLPETYRTARTRLTELDRKIVERQMAQSDLKIEARTAPDAGSEPVEEPADGLFDRIGNAISPKKTPTRQELEREIAAIDAEVASLRSARTEVIEDFRKTMAERHRLQLDDRNAELLLYQVNGGDLVDAASISGILTQMEEQLRTLFADAAGSAPEIQEQYLGVAVLNRMMIARLQARHLQHYDEVYLPALDELKAENSRIRKEGDRVVARASTAAIRSTIEANMRVLDRVDRAIALYRDVLVARRDKTAAALGTATEDAQVAMNTLNTFSVAMNFDAIVSGSMREFAALSELSAPDLLPLNDAEMYEQFLDISRQLPGS
ncbi:hypothetical protein [Rhodobacter sp. NSM]|uniref:hypothetical protein n=1 Tax=Rhodobacter sp. NSM TaxID=3457501 RepID=UPI003FD268A2